ncbi:acyl carrier protein [Archangium lipolyticum]|uniref:acyl carrier protein n=1 Tax=Archangium lipolyticum TaxID=2970465 RepID=UPI0038994791
MESHQPLTRLGLDSLAAVELAHTLEQNLGVALPMKTLPQGVSASELARELSSLQASTSPRGSIPRAPRDRPLPLSLWCARQMQESAVSSLLARSPDALRKGSSPPVLPEACQSVHSTRRGNSGGHWAISSSFALSSEVKPRPSRNRAAAGGGFVDPVCHWGS